jgi:V/A-type H+-transporting ATPase subunit I
MAIEKLKKVIIVGDKLQESKISDSLFDLGLVHVDRFDEDLIDEIGHFNNASPSKSYDDELFKIHFIFDTFKKFSIGGKGFFQSFFPDDVVVSADEFNKIIKTFNLDEVYESIIKLQARFNDLSEEESQLSQEKLFLVSCKSFPFQYSILQGTKRTKSFIGKIKSKNLYSFLVKEKALLENIYLEVFESDKNSSSIFVLYLVEDEDRVENLVKSYSIEQVIPPSSIVGFANEEVSRVSARLREIEKEKDVILSKIRDMYNLRLDLTVYKDYIESLKSKELTSSNFIDGKEVFVLKGFFKEKEIARIERLDEQDGIFTFISDPEPNDFVPVSLANNPIFRPFEFLVRLFGLPAYSNIDPTPIIAILFSVFFGICLGDTFYGLLLAIFAFSFLRKYKDNPGASRFFSILLYGGITAIIFGLLTGSFAGNFLQTYFPNSPITATLKSITLIDTSSPNDSVKFLIIALGIGVFTQLLGVFLSIVAKLKNKNYADALFNGIGWLMFLPGLVMLFFVSKYPVLKIYDNVFLFGGLTLLLVGGFMSIRTPFFKPIAALVNIYGIRSSYGISSFLGDVLSYLRLFALGLSSSILASSFNLMAKVIGSLFGNFGIVPLVLFLLALHTLAFLMNILGAFIHSMRLNFLEFFGRFYDIGGNQFKPLGFDFKNIRIKKE